MTNSVLVVGATRGLRASLSLAGRRDAIYRVVQVAMWKIWRR